MFCSCRVGAHGIYRNMEMGHGNEKKRKEKRTICIGHVQSQEVTRSNQEAARDGRHKAAVD